MRYASTWKKEIESTKKNASKNLLLSRVLESITFIKVKIKKTNTPCPRKKGEMGQPLKLAGSFRKY